MQSLVCRYQVIRVDNRGMGRSSASDVPYTIQQMANDNFFRSLYYSTDGK